MRKTMKLSRIFLSLAGMIAAGARPSSAAPTVEFMGGTVFTTTSAWKGMTSAALSLPGRGKIYFDSDDNKLFVSENATAYQPMISMNRNSSNGVLYPATITDMLAIGRSDLATGMLIVSTNATATPALFVDKATGNVGIGTTTPATQLDINGSITASAATLTAGGPAVFSLTTSSGISVGAGIVTAGDAEIGGQTLFGYTVHTVSANATSMRAACPAGTVVLYGGSRRAGTRTPIADYPTTETSDSTSAVGTAVSDGAATAGSWSCSFSGATSGNLCFVGCARVGH